MKRTHLLTVNLLLATMGLAFVCLASPATAGAPCVALGEYYTYAQQCAPRGADVGWSALLLVTTMLLGGGAGLMLLRRRVLRRD